MTWNKRDTHRWLITILAVLLLPLHGGCLLGLFDKSRRRESSQEHTRRGHAENMRRMQKYLQPFMAIGVPKSAAEIKDLCTNYGTLEYYMQPRKSYGSPEVKKRFAAWSAKTRPQVEQRYFRNMLTAIRRLGPKLPRGGYDWLTKLLRHQQRRRWRGPRTDLMPEFRKANVHRVAVTQERFSPTKGYYKHRGCVASLRPLPRDNRRLPITFHLPTASQIYMRCYLGTTVAGLQHGRVRLTLYGKVERLGSSDGRRYPIDLVVNRDKRYVDFSYDIDKVIGPKTAGVIHAGFEYRYAHGYRRVVSRGSVRLIPDYKSMFVYSVYTFSPATPGK